MDDARADLHVERAVPDHRGADRDRGVHVAVEAHVADRAGVDAAPRGLQLVDDLQRAHLRRAADGAGGERGAQHVDAGEAGLQRALDVGHDVHHVRVALDLHPVGDLDGAGLRDAADVVAAEVDQHHVLGELLGVGEQLVGERRVGLARGAARAGAGDRAQRHRLAFLAHQDLGRGADDVEVVEVVVEHVRRRVERAQRAVERQRRRRERPREALREHDLHHVAGGDVLLRPPHRGLEAVGAEFARRLRERAAGLVGNRHRLPQHAAQLLQPRARRRPGAGHRRIGVDDQVDLAGEVVDDGELLGEQQQDVGQLVDAGRPAGPRPLSRGSMWRTVS